MSGLLLSQPAAILAYVAFVRAGLLSAGVVVASVLLGVAYHLVPLGYFGVRWLARRLGAVHDRTGLPTSGQTVSG